MVNFKTKYLAQFSTNLDRFGLRIYVGVCPMQIRKNENQTKDFCSIVDQMPTPFMGHSVHSILFERKIHTNFQTHVETYTTYVEYAQYVNLSTSISDIENGQEVLMIL